MKYEHLTFNEIIQNYPKTIGFIFYTLAMCPVYVLNTIYVPKAFPITLLFLGYGLGGMVNTYICEKFHNPGNRKKMLDKLFEQVKNEHKEVVKKLVKEVEQAHTDSVLREAERIKNSDII